MRETTVTRGGARRTPGRSSAGSAKQAVSGSRLSTRTAAGRPRSEVPSRSMTSRCRARLDAEACEPVQSTHESTPSLVDEQHSVAGRRHRPDHQDRDAEHGEHLDRRRRLDAHVEDHGDPDRCVARPPPPQPARDEELGQHDELGRAGVEVPVRQDRDHPTRERADLVAGLDRSHPRHGAAEPVGIEQLAHPRGSVDDRALEPQQPQGPGGRARIERRQAAAPTDERVEGQLPPARRHGEHPEDDAEVRPVVVEVRGGKEQVVGDDHERRRRREPRQKADGHADRGDGCEPEQSDVHPARQLWIPGGIRLVERIAVDPPVQGVRQERLQVQEHDRTDEHAQQRERAHADRAPEQFVERADQRS